LYGPHTKMTNPLSRGNDKMPKMKKSGPFERKAHFIYARSPQCSWRRGLEKSSRILLRGEKRKKPTVGGGIQPKPDRGRGLGGGKNGSAVSKNPLTKHHIARGEKQWKTGERNQTASARKYRRKGGNGGTIGDVEELRLNIRSNQGPKFEKHWGGKRRGSQIRTRPGSKIRPVQPVFHN